jgi:hypothetical protein
MKVDDDKLTHRICKVTEKVWRTENTTTMGRRIDILHFKEG